MFPGFLKRLADDGGTPQYARPMCTGDVKSKGQGELQKDINNLKVCHEKLMGPKRGFMNAASPGVISLFFYKTIITKHAMHIWQPSQTQCGKKYETIVASGLDLQLDCPDLALSRHMLFQDLSDKEFLKVAGNSCRSAEPRPKKTSQQRRFAFISVGVNYEGPHCCDIPMNTVFSTLMSTKAQHLLFETSNPRHAHEWTVFRDRKSEIPDNKILIPGGCRYDH